MYTYTQGHVHIERHPCIYWAIQAALLAPLTFAWHRLSPLAAFYFRCVLSSQWKAVTVNLRILHCQL